MNETASAIMARVEKWAAILAVATTVVGVIWYESAHRARTEMVLDECKGTEKQLGDWTLKLQTDMNGVKLDNVKIASSLDAIKDTMQRQERDTLAWHDELRRSGMAALPAVAPALPAPADGPPAPTPPPAKAP